MDWHAIVADFQAHLWTYLAMPLVAGFVGYTTKILAVEMMFRPIEFVGIKPWLGWQGVVPRKAAKMASTATGLLVGKLITVEELIGRLDPKRVLKEIEQPLYRATEDLIHDLGERYLPSLWLSLPEIARKAVIGRIQDEIPALADQIWRDVTKDFSRYFDIRHMLVSNLVKDKALLNEVLKRVGVKEFVFFRNAGFYFGFALGLVQLACWLLWHQPWLMPLFGGIVGFTSDWIALQMLFRPLEPKKILGFTFQGKFIARQKEVARDYAAILAKQLLTPANMVEELLRGPFADRVIELVHRHVRKATDEQLGVARPLVVFAMGSAGYREMREFMVKRILELLPETSKHVEQYAMDALDINNTIVSRMDLLTPKEFEGLLRPAFKEDEMTLILAGAVLGALIGEMQVHWML